MNPFPYIYYSAAGLGAIAAILAVDVKRRTYAYAAVAVLLTPLVFAYLTGMYRSGGIDYENYQAYLGSGREDIPDVGYRLLMEAIAALGLNLSEFFLLQGLFSLWAVWLLAKKLRSDFVIALTLYLLHGALVRDFTQSRAGLALVIYFVAVAQDRKVLYAALTVAACSVHLSLVPLVAVYHWARAVNGMERGRMFFTVAPAVVLVAGISLLFQVLMMVDPRVETYLNWKQDEYGNPVGSYSGILLFLLLALICHRAHRVTGDKESQVFVIMIMYAVAIFIAFRDVSVFAFRLSNAVAALYPFAVGRAITLLKSARQDPLHDPAKQGRLDQVALPLALVGALLAAIATRSGNADILEATQPALLF